MILLWMPPAKTSLDPVGTGILDFQSREKSMKNPPAEKRENP